MDDHDVVFTGEGHEPHEEIVLDDGAGRIVGIADEDHPGPGQDGRVDGLEVGLKAELGPQRQMDRRAVGDQRPGRVDRVTRIARQRNVALVQQGETDVGDALLGAQEGHDLGLLVERDAEPVIIV